MPSETSSQRTQRPPQREPAPVPAGTPFVTLGYGCPTSPPDCSYESTRAEGWLEAALGPVGARVAAGAGVTVCHVTIHIRAKTDLPAFDVSLAGGAGITVASRDVSVPALTAGQTWSSAVGFTIGANVTSGTVNVGLGAPLDNHALQMRVTLNVGPARAP